MIELVNRQRHRKIDLKAWEAFVARVLPVIEPGQRGVTIAFVSDQQMRKLNRTFRAVDSSTDVLSFPAGSDELVPDTERTLGDLAISVEQAEKQARENGLEFEQEVAQLILHGLLHLRGYDHETDNGEMNRLELKLRRTLGIQD
jgi:probable rRNA maturation factor